MVTVGHDEFEKRMPSVKMDINTYLVEACKSGLGCKSENHGHDNKKGAVKNDHCHLEPGINQKLGTSHFGPRHTIPLVEVLLHWPKLNSKENEETSQYVYSVVTSFRIRQELWMCLRFRADGPSRMIK